MPHVTAEFSAKKREGFTREKRKGARYLQVKKKNHSVEVSGTTQNRMREERDVRDKKTGTVVASCVERAVAEGVSGTE